MKNIFVMEKVSNLVMNINFLFYMSEKMQKFIGFNMKVVNLIQTQFLLMEVIIPFQSDILI